MTMVEIRGTFISPDGSPAKGSITFQPRVDAVIDGESIIVRDPVVVRLVKGSFATELQATDSGLPVAWTYEVHEQIEGQYRTYDISVPAASASAGIDLVDIVPISPAVGDVETFVLLPAFNALESRVDSAESGLSALEPRLDVAESDILAVDLRVDSVESGLGAEIAAREALSSSLGSAAMQPSSAFVSSRAAGLFDPAGKPDGTVTAMDTGQALTNFGNAPLSVSNGVIRHFPSGSGVQAGYIQLDAGARIRRVGLRASWPVSALGGVALVVPSAAWSQGVLPPAGIHLVVYGNGIWYCGRFNENGTITYYADYSTHGRPASMWTNSMVDIDMWVDPATNTATVFWPDGTTARFTHASIGADTSNYAVWELYENVGTDVPATIGEIWADTAAPMSTGIAPTKAQVAAIIRGMAQPLDADLTSIAGLATTPFGRARLTDADASAARTALGLGTLATQSGSFSGTSFGLNSGDQWVFSGVTGDTGSVTANAPSDVIAITGAGQASTAAAEIPTESGSVASLVVTVPGPYVQTFTTPGAGTLDINPLIEAGYTRLHLEAQGSGGPGGSGRRGAPGTVRCAGGPGGTGAFMQAEVSLARLLELFPTGLVPYNVGIGTVGGAAVLTDDTNGNNGVGGATATAATWLGSAGGGGSVILAVQGSPGSGGSATSGAAGNIGLPTMLYPGANAGIAASTTGGLSTNVILGTSGAGGGITAANVPSNGAAGQAASLSRINGGTAGVVDGAAPTQGSASPVGPGSGVGGGAASITGPAQAGADGLPNAGQGGGGGGASTNGFPSGKGGDGSTGYLRATAY